MTRRIVVLPAKIRRVAGILLFAAAAAYAQHPRLALDATALANIRARAKANTAEWQALRPTCDGLAAAPVYPQRSLDERYDWGHTGGVRTNTRGLITVGYQGGATGPKTWSYADLYELGICYQATVVDNPALAATYGAKLSAIADVLSVVAGEVSMPVAASSVTAGAATTVNAKSHGLQRGYIIRIAGATGDWAAANGVWNIPAITADTFTFALDSRAFQGGFDGTIQRIEYIADTTWALGTAWQAGAAINGAQSSSGQVALRGLVPGGTILSGDSFNVNRAYSFVVKCASTCAPGTVAATADANGRATVSIGSELTGQIPGTLPNTEYPDGGLTDGWPVSYEIVLAINSHSIPTGRAVTVSGVAGNTAANGNWNVVALSDGAHLLLDASGPGNGTQTNEVWDAATNAGFGARVFGPFLAELYDWYFDGLTPAQKTGLRAELKRWLAAEKKLGVAFGLSNPNGNYFQGFMNCWVYGALAIEPEDPQGTAYYNEFRAAYFDVKPRGIADFYSNVQPDYMHGDGGGAYGVGAASDLLDMVTVMMTAKGYNPLTDPHPFTWAPGLAKWLVGNTRPDLTGYNTRGINVTTLNDLGLDTDYVRVSLKLSYRVYNLLAATGDPFLPYFQSYLRTVRPPLKAITKNTNPNFYTVTADEFLMYDPAAAATDYTTLPTYYKAASAGEYTWRSDWSSSGIFASFLAGPYLDSVESVKDAKDRGNLTITKGGKQTLLTNIYWEYARYAAYLPSYYSTIGGYDLPQLQNILQVNTGVAGTSYSQRGYGPGFGVFSSNYDPLNCAKSNPSNLARAETTGAYTYVRGERLEYNYPVTATCNMNVDGGCCATQRAVTSWTREVFNAGGVFLVYDRSQVSNSMWDHFLAWHFPRTPTETTAPAGMRRYDVQDAESFAEGPAFKGTVHTILPANRSESLRDPFPQYRYHDQPVGYRLEVHNPAGAGENRWLTMFEVVSSAAAARTPTLLTSSNADAVQLNDADATVVAFPRGDTASLPIQYRCVSIAAKHYVTGLGASAPYHVTVEADGTVTVSAPTGTGDALTSAGGVLSFSTTPPAATILRGIYKRGVGIR